MKTKEKLTCKAVLDILKTIRFYAFGSLLSSIQLPIDSAESENTPNLLYKLRSRGVSSTQVVIG